MSHCLYCGHCPLCGHRSMPNPAWPYVPMPGPWYGGTISGDFKCGTFTAASGMVPPEPPMNEPPKESKSA